MPVTHSKEITCGELAAKYVSQIKGKVVLTTGVSPNGMGAHFVTSIAAAEPTLLVLVGRSREKLEETASAITQKHDNVSIKQLVFDLSSMDAVRQAAAEVNHWDDVPKIDIVVCNSAIMKVPYQLTSDNFELQLATNYLGHFLFINLIMRKILAADSPRIITLGSDGHRLSPLRWGDIHFDNGALYNGWAAYGQSKTAMMLMAVSLAKKLGGRGLLAFTIHPGLVFTTNLAKHLDPAIDIPNLRQYDREIGSVAGFAEQLGTFAVSAEQGAATYVYAAFEPSLKDHNGAYLTECRLADPAADIVRPWATSDVEADLWWKQSEQLVGESFSF